MLMFSVFCLQLVHKNFGKKGSETGIRNVYIQHKYSQASGEIVSVFKHSSKQLFFKFINRNVSSKQRKILKNLSLIIMTSENMMVSIYTNKSIIFSLHGNEAAAGFVGHAFISGSTESLSSNGQIRFILN